MKLVKEPKDNVLVSFSGGETSAYMINYLLKNYPNLNFRFIIANTGEENEASLIFAKRVQDYFNINLIWVEYCKDKGYKEVNFQTAYRSHNIEEIKNNWPNHPFRHYIEKFGIPNVQNMSCTRELKEYPINRYLSANGWKPKVYDKAIGIRSDELDRVGKYWYPLIKIDATKPMINAFWDKMPFRLEIKGWEGNCKVCWKKSIRKLITIARYYPERFAFFKIIEEEYGGYLSKGRQGAFESIEFPIKFFRENKGVNDIFYMAKDLSIEDATDDSLNTNYQTSIYHDGTELDIVNGCVESCNAFN